jgi:hypothetical protein
MKKELREYLAKIGAKGGKASRRTLTPEQAKAMVAAREAKRLEKLKRHAGRSNKADQTRRT